MNLVRSGKVPEVIRRKGAAGNLPLPAEDNIEILTLLAAAPEADLREKALETLQGWEPCGSPPGNGQPPDGAQMCSVSRRSNLLQGTKS